TTAGVQLPHPPRAPRGLCVSPWVHVFSDTHQPHTHRRKQRTMNYKVIDRYKVRDTRFGRKPRNAVEALRQARDFLIQEGQDRWIKGAEMAVKDRGALAKRRFNPKDPSWSQWGVCAIGAVALVTGDMQVTVV